MVVRPAAVLGCAWPRAGVGLLRRVCAPRAGTQPSPSIAPPRLALQLYQHIAKTGAQFAVVFEDDVVITAPRGGLLAALLEAKPFPGARLALVLLHPLGTAAAAS